MRRISEPVLLFFMSLFVVILLPIDLFGAFHLEMSLKDAKEILDYAGYWKGGEITPEGFKVTSQDTGLIIPLPHGLDVRKGYISIKMKNLPKDGWPHDPECPPGDSPQEPWAKTVFGMGISPDNLWAGEGGSGYIESHYSRCNIDCTDWQGYRGAFRHKFRGMTPLNITCWATTVETYHFCDDPNEVLEITHKWDMEKYNVYENGIDVTAEGDACGILDRFANWYIHIAHGDDNQRATNGDITGAIFFDLVVHFDDSASNCGDKICNKLEGEDCSTCPADCGCKEPCYVCKNGSCECNSPAYECPSCKPSCKEVGRLSNTEVVCCSSGFICESGKRVFESYDCRTCCEGARCIGSYIEEDGGYSDISQDIKGEDMEAKDGEVDAGDVYGYDVRDEVVVEDVGSGDVGDVGEDTEVNGAKNDTGVLKDTGTTKEESSGCGCSLID